MIIVTEDITFIKSISILVSRLRLDRNIRMQVYVVSQRNLFISTILSKLFKIDIIDFKWNFFDLKNNHGTCEGQLVRKNFSNSFLKILDNYKINDNPEFLDYKNFQIFLVKRLMDGPFHLSKKSIINNIIIIYAIKNLMEKKGFIKATFLTENFPFDYLLKEHITNYDIDLKNLNYYLSFSFLNIFFKSIIFKKFITLKKYFRLLNNSYQFIKYKNIGNKSIVFDNDMMIHNPIKFNNPNSLDRKSTIYVAPNWYLSEQQERELKREDYNFIPLEFYPSKRKKNKFYTSNNQKFKFFKIKNFNFNINEKILYTRAFKEYLLYLNGWYDFFEKSNAKIFVTTNKFSYSQIAASSAISKLSGVSAVIQNSFYEFPWSNGILDYDVSFCFSNFKKDLEINTGSRIKQQIAVGYTNDYKFINFKQDAKLLRNKLLENGAKKIVCFFDQGSVDDTRWSLSNEISAKGYKFLLEKVIKNDWMGLIIKPKKPGLLKSKIVDIENVLNKAVATGRVYIVKSTDTNHVKNASIIPAYIAMASDVSVHDTMVSGTAGFEAALTKTPNFYLDLYNFNESIFYCETGKKIVFKNWDETWNAIINLFDRNLKFEDFYWNELLNKLDPYQDGKSFQRINEYLSALDFAYKKGYSKDDVLKYAANDFSNKWGDDKIMFFEK